ncbi:RNA polymerase RpoE-like sigma-24 subunit [Mucilaginibacter yixingensis]|uniref:RNA polymerase RpoE-like sigma-24 subunit n=1 Tax=Mucilaginibacter yixingensis TaxID=1295612 RepID=A0A2T5JD26_9SPHI|nr:sigma-70 family RNA polymerase sigma factor [Mucilaginibacter yixingensis]PTQ99660.1 RNA polymerase RpoE-like sigma-24 subunit [Mucilaginibacter yixingensis]
MDQLSDEAIVGRILQGEAHLFENLMRKYNERLYRISLSIVEDDQEAEDVMQIAYINAFRQLENFRQQCAFGTWLTRILINESLLHKKRNQRTEQLRMETTFAEANNETPLSGLLNKELKLILERAVAALPEKYRLVFVMREVQGMSTNETMEALNLGESNVKIRLNRAKEMLRAELQQLWQPQEIFEFNLVRCGRIVNNVMQAVLAGE